MRTELPSSKLLHSYRYDPATKTLEIEFRRKPGRPAVSIYKYSPVTQETVDAFLKAESHGAFILKEIIPKCGCEKGEPDDESKSH